MIHMYPVIFMTFAVITARRIQAIHPLVLAGSIPGQQSSPCLMSEPQFAYFELKTSVLGL